MPISATDLNKAYLAYFGRPADLDVILTTPDVSPEVLKELRAEGVEVQLVEQED